MSKKMIGFIPPREGAGFSAVFWSLIAVLNEKEKTGGVVIPEFWGLSSNRHSLKDILTGSSPPESNTLVSYSRLALSKEEAGLLSTLLGRLVFLLEENQISWPENTWLEEVPVLFIAFSPSMEEVVRTKRVKGSLLSMGVKPDQIKLILCSDGMPGGLPCSLLKKELGEIAFILPYEPELCLEASHQGVLLQQLKPRSSLFREIVKIGHFCQSELKKKQSEGLGMAGKGVEVLLKDLERRITTQLWYQLGREEYLHTDKPKHIRDHIERKLEETLGEELAHPISKPQILQLRQNIRDHLLGLGPLEPYLRKSDVTEIMVNGNKQIFVERNGRIQEVSESFLYEEQLKIIIDRIVGKAGRRVDHATPLCDVRLPDGSRANIVLPPISLNGPVLTIRRFKTSLLGFEDLRRAGSINHQQIETLKKMVRERKNILIAGNTGSGKTTLLNILSREIPAQERILTLEDTAELQLQQPHVIRLETRMKNAEGEGGVRMNQLVANALRMRPDRIIVGEVRGDEVIPMLQAMNTGHDGSMTTVHSNSAMDALKRLESMILLGAPQWPIEVIRQQIAAGIDAIVYLKRQDGKRRVQEVVEFELVKGEFKERHPGETGCVIIR